MIATSDIPRSTYSRSVKLGEIALEGKPQPTTELDVDAFLTVIADVVKRILADEANTTEPS